MVCPHCKKETSTGYRDCQNCHADLEEYKLKVFRSLENTGEDLLDLYKPSLFRIIFNLVRGIFYIVIILFLLIENLLIGYQPIDPLFFPIIALALLNLIFDIYRYKKRKKHSYSKVKKVKA